MLTWYQIAMAQNWRQTLANRVFMTMKTLVEAKRDAPRTEWFQESES